MVDLLNITCIFHALYFDMTSKRAYPRPISAIFAVTTWLRAPLQGPNKAVELTFEVEAEIIVEERECYRAPALANVHQAQDLIEKLLTCLRHFFKKEHVNADVLDNMLIKSRRQ